MVLRKGFPLFPNWLGKLWAGIIELGILILALKLGGRTEVLEYYFGETWGTNRRPGRLKRSYWRTLTRSL